MDLLDALFTFMRCQAILSNAVAVKETDCKHIRVQSLMKKTGYADLRSHVWYYSSIVVCCMVSLWLKGQELSDDPTRQFLVQLLDHGHQGECT